VQIAIWPTWAFLKIPKEGGGFWWKLPSLLGRAELAWTRWAVATSLFSPINRGRRADGKGSALLVLRNHSKLVRKIVSVKKMQAEALP